MKILVDSNIVIDYLKNNSHRFIEVVNENILCISPIVRSEVLIGAKNDREYKSISKLLLGFEYLDFKDNFWERFDFLRFRLKKSGVIVPFQDVVLSQTAIDHCVSIWTDDHHFKLIQPFANELKLYQS